MTNNTIYSRICGLEINLYFNKYNTVLRKVIVKARLSIGDWWMRFHSCPVIFLVFSTLGGL